MDLFSPLSPLIPFVSIDEFLSFFYYASWISFLRGLVYLTANLVYLLYLIGILNLNCPHTNSSSLPIPLVFTSSGSHKPFLPDAQVQYLAVIFDSSVSLTSPIPSISKSLISITFYHLQSCNFGESRLRFSTG